MMATKKTPKAKPAAKAPAKVTKADALESVIADLNALAERDDVPTSYAGRLQAIANRIDSCMKRAGG